MQGNPTTAPAAIDAKVGPEASFAQREAAALALAKVGPEASFAQREAAALAPNDATRLFLQDDLLAMVDRYGEHIEVEGACYKRHELGTVRYYTLCGTIDLERWTYRAMGVHNGPTVVPVDLEAGLVERTTPALGARIMLGYAKNHMRSAEEDMQADHRCPPSRSTLERVAKAMGTAARRVAPQIERRVRQAERVPEGAVAIVLGLDRTAVPMEEDLADGTPPKRRRTTPYVRTPPAPVTVNYRMAYVGTVSFHDAEGTELATRHYGAAAHEAPTDRLVRPMLADLRHALQQMPTLAVGVVQDGAPELWNLLAAAVVAEPLVTRSYEATIGITSTNAWRTCCGAWNPTPRRARPNCRDGMTAWTGMTRPSIGSGPGSVTSMPPPSRTTTGPNSTRSPPT